MMSERERETICAVFSLTRRSPACEPVVCAPDERIQHTKNTVLHCPCHITDLTANTESCYVAVPKQAAQSRRFTNISLVYVSFHARLSYTLVLSSIPVFHGSASLYNFRFYLLSQSPPEILQNCSPGERVRECVRACVYMVCVVARASGIAGHAS